MMLLIVLTLLFVPLEPIPPEPVTGWASQYAKGVMERVLDYRIRHGTVIPDNVDGYVAAQECSDIGKIVYLRPLGSQNWESFWVADCAGPHLRPDGLTGYQWMLRYNILVEVDWETAVRWDTVGRGIKVEMRE